MNRDAAPSRPADPPVEPRRIDAADGGPIDAVQRDLAAQRADAYDKVYKGWSVKRITREVYEASTRFFLDAPGDQPGHLDGNELECAFRLLDVDHLAGRTILDYCCGTGRSSLYFALRGARVWGVDRSMEAICNARAAARLSGVEEQARFAVMDAQELSFADEAFDAVFCQSALHIIIDYPACATQLCRVLKPGGRAIFCEEALGHNPALELVRWFRRRKHRECGGRTLHYRDIESFGRAFHETRIHHFNLLLQVKQFLGKGAHRPAVKRVLRGVRAVDQALLTMLPFARRYCGKIVVEYIRSPLGAKAQA